MATTERIFNNRPRKVFRNRISNKEVYFSVAFIFFVVLMGAWFAAQSDNYDPGERDIPMEVMIASSVEDNLYRTPLERWVDPAEAAAAPGAAPAAKLGIFPPEIVSGGWTPSSRLQEFDPSNLYEKIDGQAPQYVDYGFERLHFVSLEMAGAGLDINIELYDMGSLQNAMGIFGAQRDVARTLTPAGDAYYYTTELGALGIAGQYYFKISGNTVDPAIVDKATEIAGAFGSMANASGGAVPKAFVVLAQTLEVPFEGVTYEKVDVFQFGFAKDFWFGKPGNGTDLRYYLHECSEDETDGGLYDELLTNHQFDHDVVVNEDGYAVLKHQFLGTFQALTYDQGWVYGVDGAPDADAAETALTLLEGALFNGEEM